VEPARSFVIARLELDFRRELTWPGEVAIGTEVEAVGRSSFTLRQGHFQNDECAALARTVIVQVDEESGRSQPLSAATSAQARRLSSLAPVVNLPDYERQQNCRC
jgi:acyl-CoA thioester hydrolase